MAEGKCRESWDHTACMLAVLINTNRDPKKSSAVKPSELNPYTALTQKKASGKVKKVKLGFLKAMFVDKDQQAIFAELMKDGSGGD